MCQIFTVYIYIYMCVCVCVYSHLIFIIILKDKYHSYYLTKKENWGTKRISNFSKVTQLTAASWKCKDNNKPQ